MKILLFLVLYLEFQCEVNCKNAANRVRVNNKLYIPKYKRGIDIFHANKYNENENEPIRNGNKMQFIKKQISDDTNSGFPISSLTNDNSVGLNKYQKQDLAFISIPGSLYFPNHRTQKGRVKKQLPSYISPFLRKKRAVDPKISSRRSKSKRNMKNKKGNKRHLNRDTVNKREPKEHRRPKARKDASPRRGSKQKSSKDRHRLNGKRSGTRKRSEKKEEPTRRLIAGRDALIEDYPYVISIQKGGEHWCAGALLNPRLGITTANCLWKANRVSKLLVRAGSQNPHRGGQLTKIQEVRKHPGWSTRKNPDHDVALILLSRDLKFSHSLHAVDLPNRYMLPAFNDVWVASYGASKVDGKFDTSTSTLQVYHVNVLDRDKCNNITKRFGVAVTENFICTTQNNRRAPCTRDTGAPAVSDGILWGLASWSIRKLCGTERFPAMFSYLASKSNMDFIINATRYMMSEERERPFLEHYNPQRHKDIKDATLPDIDNYY